MRFTRWDQLGLAERELLRFRLKRSAQIGAAFGVSMGLAHLPNSLFSLAEPGDPAWRPIVMGALNGGLMFVFQFFVLTRRRFFASKDPHLAELIEQAEHEAEMHAGSRELAGKDRA